MVNKDEYNKSGKLTILLVTKLTSFKNSILDVFV